MLVVFTPWNLANSINKIGSPFFFPPEKPVCTSNYRSTLLVFAALNQAVPLYLASCWTSLTCHVTAWAVHTCMACGLSQYQATFIWVGKQLLSQRPPVGICCSDPGSSNQLQTTLEGWDEGGGWKEVQEGRGHMHPQELTHADAWQKPAQHCEPIILQS